jgi:hypothetical protein
MVALNTSNPTIFENNKWIFLRNKTGFHILMKKKKDRLLVPGDEDENGISNPMMVFIVLIHQLFQNESS